ncbi:complement C3-like [Onychostoma macrolepis]|uniref:complement C3-like n=1 Tax=Onychostoma macrolepis TaxID=369639 RepID=UPI00272D5B7C|nr:complement C3-like [Onychostoma macrolepis]
MRLYDLSGIVDDPESVLDDKGPLVRTWFDGLLSEYRSALPFLDLTWSTGSLQNSLDSLATWERDSDVKARVKIAAASFKVNTENRQKHARCKKFYHPERTDGALYKLCKGDLCLCAEENCSFQKKNRVRDEERLNRACESGVDYVYKVTVDSDIYDMKVEQVLRKGTDEEVEGKVRPFLARPSCREYLGLVNGKSYLIMGKSVDLPMLGGSQQYIFGQQTWVEYWPTREESQTLEHRKRYIGIIELMNSLFRHGCAV